MLIAVEIALSVGGIYLSVPCLVLDPVTSRNAASPGARLTSRAARVFAASIAVDANVHDRASFDFRLSILNRPYTLSLDLSRPKLYYLDDG